MEAIELGIRTMTQEQLYDHLVDLETMLANVQRQVLAAEGWHKYRINEKILAAIIGKRDELKDLLEESRAHNDLLSERIDKLQAELEAERSQHTSLLKEAISRASGDVLDEWEKHRQDFLEFVKAHPEYSTAMLAKHFKVSHSTIYNWSHGHKERPKPVVHKADFRRQVNGFMGRKPHATPEEVAARFNLDVKRVRDYLASRMTVTVEPTTGLVQEVAFG